jgi:hypothetical protein
MDRDSRLRFWAIRNELIAEAKSAQGEWMGRGSSDYILKGRIDLMRKAAHAIDELVHYEH